MREYVCAPRPRRCGAWWVISGLILLTALLWFLPSVFSVPYPIVVFFFSLVFLTFAMMLVSRCVLCRYVYRLEATESGDFDFVVDEVRRLRSFCVCRVGVGDICAVELQDKARRPRPDFDWRVYGNAPVYRLTLIDGEETVVVRITPDATLVAILVEALRSHDFTTDGKQQE